jgi:hypothetical protein
LGRRRYLWPLINEPVVMRWWWRLEMMVSLWLRIFIYLENY